MEIVINRCFGGFGLSPRAYKRLAELQGKQCFFFGGIRDKNEITLEQAESNGLFFQAFSVNNPNDFLQADWHLLSDAEKDASNKRYRSVVIDDMDDDRTNPLLVQVVKELGEAASGQCADLKIVEIPDGVDWEIDEYDGNESIHEKHRSW